MQDPAKWFQKLSAEFKKKQSPKGILAGALTLSRELTNCDAGTVYLRETRFSDNQFTPQKIDGEFLHFDVIQNDTMKISKRSDQDDIGIPPVPLRINGSLNTGNVSAYCYNTNQVINIADVYCELKFDFTGTKKYDQAFGYRSKSMLVYPLVDGAQKTIGVFQLINKKDEQGELIAFTKEDEIALTSMSVIMGMVVSIQNLYTQQKELFNSLINMLAKNIEEKSPHTFDHIHRVTILSCLIAEAVSENNEGLYGGTNFSDFDIEEIKTAALLHDIGKISIPETILGKAVKLQTYFDRMELIRERYNSAYKDQIINMLEKKISMLHVAPSSQEDFDSLDKELDEARKNFQEKLVSIADYNYAHETKVDDIELLILSESAENHIQHFPLELDQDSKVDRFITSKFPVRDRLIRKEELDCLLIGRGTLSYEEREIIKSHASKSWSILKSLSFPTEWRAIPMIASSHHECLDGSGYPFHLTGDQMPLKARIIAVADLVEALSSRSRPYRKPFTVNQFLEVLGKLVKSKKIDGEVLYTFICSQQFKKFIVEYIGDDQLNDFDPKEWHMKFYLKPPDCPEF